MNDEIEFFTNPLSRGRTVRWMLEELETPYKTVIVSYGAEMKGADYRVINPLGKVPALRHRGIVITETAAILAYLADQFPHKNLAPEATSAKRGAYYKWMFFAVGALEYAIVNRQLGFVAKPEDARHLGYGTYEEAVSAVDSALQTAEFLTGEFSAADILLSSFLAWSLFNNTIDKRPSFERYVAEMTKRPAFKRASSIDNGLIAQQR